jgi:nucleotide-binding universal stress UspA family protein
MSYTKILVTLDGSTFAERALPIAISLAEAYEAKLVLLSIFDSSDHVTAAEQARQVDAVGEYLAEKVAALRNLGISAESILIAGGDVAHLILVSADSHQCDLIIMTTHGRSGLSRWRLGSIAERVVRHSTRPVMLIRSSDEDDYSRAIHPVKHAIVV